MQSVHCVAGLCFCSGRFGLQQLVKQVADSFTHLDATQTLCSMRDWCPDSGPIASNAGTSDPLNIDSCFYVDILKWSGQFLCCIKSPQMQTSHGNLTILYFDRWFEWRRLLHVRTMMYCGRGRSTVLKKKKKSPA